MWSLGLLLRHLATDANVVIKFKCARQICPILARNVCHGCHSWTASLVGSHLSNLWPSTSRVWAEMFLQLGVSSKPVIWHGRGTWKPLGSSRFETVASREQPVHGGCSFEEHQSPALSVSSPASLVLSCWFATVTTHIKSFFVNIFLLSLQGFGSAGRPFSKGPVCFIVARFLTERLRGAHCCREVAQSTTMDVCYGCTRQSDPVEIWTSTVAAFQLHCVLAFFSYTV
jgi:predicted Fe-S protein YdhL (DUF1289 family)